MADMFAFKRASSRSGTVEDGGRQLAAAVERAAELAAEVAAGQRSLRSQAERLNEVSRRLIKGKRSLAQANAALLNKTHVLQTKTQKLEDKVRTRAL